MELNGKKVSLGIVGGGRGGTAIFHLFKKLEDIEIKYIVDQDYNASAMALARAEGIESLIDMKYALKNKPTDFVIEATGVDEVLKTIMETVTDETEVIPHKVALFLYNAFKANINESACLEIIQVQEHVDGSIGKVHILLKEIERLSEYLKIIAMNALVESGRLGKTGAGFAVVANEIKNVADLFQKSTHEIEVLNNKSQTVVKKIEQTIEKLQS